MLTKIALTSSKSIFCTWSKIKESTLSLPSSFFYFTSFDIFCDVQSFTCSLSVPEIPFISPFVPSNIEFMYAYALLSEHESDMLCEHTVMRITMDNNAFITGELSKFTHNSRFLAFCIFICSVYSRNTDGTYNMFFIVFSL